MTREECHEWKAGHGQIEQPLDHCWYSDYRIITRSLDCMGNCPIVFQLLCQIQLSRYARILDSPYWIRPCGVTAGRVNDIFVSNMPDGTAPRFFSPPNSPCPSTHLLPSHHPSIEAVETPWTLHNVSFDRIFCKPKSAVAYSFSLPYSHYLRV